MAKKKSYKKSPKKKPATQRSMPIARPPQGVGLMRAMGQPEPLAPSSPTGARPGQIEQEALKRMLMQRMLNQMRQQGPV